MCHSDSPASSQPWYLKEYGNTPMQYTAIFTAVTACSVIYPTMNSLGGLAHWLASRTTDKGVPGSRPGRGTVCCGLEQVTFTTA